VQTITFYAYKGGTGRTLALANAAKYLSRLGQSVVAIDLDLEAPGLHHKFRLNSLSPFPPISRGIVDCLHEFQRTQTVPDSLAPFAVDVSSHEERDGRILLIPAGDAVTATYWRRLAELNWHELFYKEGAEGVLFFLELKERIRKEFTPDFLLIDARTGITEIGGVATTLLPDQVVCLILNNRENLEGTREVLRGITKESTRSHKSIRVVPVLARLPGLARRADSDAENQLASDVRAYLCDNADDPTTHLELESVLVLHSEESLAYGEALRIGGSMTVDESPLLRDYLRLFSQIIPKEDVEPHLDRLVNTAMKNLLDKPDRVQADLEALATYCPHATSYLALLKFYRLRNADSTKILQTAVRFWQLDGHADDPLLWEVVGDHFNPRRGVPSDADPMLGTFVDQVWRQSRTPDPDVGLRLVDFLLSQRSNERAVEVIGRLLDLADVKPDVVVRCIQRAVDAEKYGYAQSIVEQWTGALAENSEFQSAWASLIVRQHDSVRAKELFASKDFRPASILAKAPATYAELLMLAGRKDELEAALQNLLDRAIGSGDSDQILQSASIFEEVGQLEVFKAKVQKSLPRAQVERIFEMIGRRSYRVGGVSSGRTRRAAILYP